MNLHDAKEFLNKYRLQLTGEEEHQQFTEWLKNASDSELESITGEWNEASGQVHPQVEMPGKQAFLAEMGVKLNLVEAESAGYASVVPLQRQKLLLRYTAAAAVLFFIAGALYYGRKTGSNNSSSAVQIVNDVSPAAGKPLLTLADGSTIVLDANAKGKIASQGALQVIKMGSAMLSYRKLEASEEEKKNKELVYNKLVIPRGMDYQLILPDGSLVHLNALSSLRYPTTFPGKERVVELTGEGYFEIAKNAEKPFRVKVNNSEIEVLGTVFNVMAYDDEPAMATTLLEGSVKMKNGDYQTLLKPGQQARVSGSDARISLLNGVNVDDVVAWRKGVLSIYKANIQEVMRQIKRWYDVDVKNESSFRGHITGEIPRNMKLSEVLKVLEFSGVKARLENNIVIITN